MAGPAIRSWEIAKALSQIHEVFLSTPNEPDISPDGFLFKPRGLFPLSKIISSVDVVITQLVPYQMAWQAKRHGVRIILDAYDPMPLENLELFQFFSGSIQDYKNARIVNATLFAFQMADAVICANTKQRDLWTGLLMGLGRITPDIYAQDKTLKNLIDIVPFGLPSNPPLKSGDGLRKMFDLSENDKVILWGGGIWNWFDPLSLIKAVKKLVEEEYPVHLVFMGLKHPNPYAPEMKMTSNAIQLAKDYDLINKYVFFNYGWTPYQQRQNFLLDSDIGASIHSEHLETQYSFRTRMLDYIWAGLPILATEGDSFADLIKSNDLGRVVPYGEIKVIAEAIRDILEPSTKKRIGANLAEMRPKYSWDSVVNPLFRMIDIFSAQPKQKMSFQEICRILSSMTKAYGPKAIFQELLYRFNSK
jgi:glycosyltransferase involved in cell wall biosynthesis